MTHTFLVKATVYYEIDEQETVEYGIVHAEDYASAASIVEEHFKSSLCDMALVMTEDDDFTFIDRTIYNRLYYGEFDIDGNLLDRTENESAANDVPEFQAQTSPTDDVDLSSDFR